jgi:hypothetical protein
MKMSVLHRPVIPSVVEGSPQIGSMRTAGDPSATLGMTGWKDGSREQVAARRGGKMDPANKSRDDGGGGLL